VRQSIEQDVRKAYQKPTLNRLNLKQAMQVLLGRARDLLPFLRPDPRQTIHEEVPKLYQKPTLRKLTPEQACLILIGHASVGDQGAKDLLDLIFRDERRD
jgi:hypothetical protein